MKCYILFEYNKHPICGCWKEGESAQECKLKAEFALICKYPNVEYDTVKTMEVMK